MLTLFLPRRCRRRPALAVRRRRRLGDGGRVVPPQLPPVLLRGREAEALLGAVREVQARGAPGDDAGADAHAGLGGQVLEGPGIAHMYVWVCIYIYILELRAGVKEWGEGERGTGEG